MSDGADDILTRPLGIAGPEPRARLRAWRPTRRTLVAALGGSVAVFGGLLAVMGDPRGGEPRISAAIALREAAPAQKSAAAAMTSEPERNTFGRRSASEVEEASGVTVTRLGGGRAPDEPVIIRVPTPDTVRLAMAPDPRLVERGRHGSLPKMGAAGLRALDVYARPDASAPGPRIAIVMGGLGTSQMASAAAIARLPPAISFALSPYAGDLDKTAASARKAGHEILVQAPMEPFDYPDSDPGPQTLLTSLRAPENLDRLAWAMSRFPGAIGITNLMGAKLLSDPAALEPLIKEIGARGLGFIDDGSASGSQASAIAGKLKTPVARAQVVIDAVPRPDAIDRELSRLEDQARSSGLVLASASAQQMTIDRIARWARELEARGVQLVPASVALRAPGPTAKLSSAAR